MDPAKTEGFKPDARSQKSHGLATTITYPRLIRQDAESIRSFMSQYRQYCNEVFARSAQLSDDSLEPLRPVNLKFCVDAQFLRSTIRLGFIEDVMSYEELTDTQLTAYLESMCGESTEFMTLSTLDALVKSKLRMNMREKSALRRMQYLFSSYDTLLEESGLLWVLDSNQKVAIGHVLSVIKPEGLQFRLQDDLEFSKVALRKDFKGFMKHAIAVSKAWQMTDSGPRRGNSTAKNSSRGGNPDNQNGKSGGKGGGNATSSSTTGAGSSASASEPAKSKSRQPPLCAMPTCKKKELRHYWSECPEPESTKEAKRAELKTKREAEAAVKAKDGPSKSTRAQKADQAKAADAKPTTGRLKVPTLLDGPSIKMEFAEDTASVDCVGRCDDGSDDSLIAPHFAEQAVLEGIGKMKKIPTVEVSVALKKGDEAQAFKFSRTWTVPRTVLNLPSGKLAVLNVSFLVADDDLACENALIGHPVLEHMKVDTKTLLDENRERLDGIDCGSVGNPTRATTGGYVSRLMGARYNGEIDKPASCQPTIDASRPKVNYFESRNEEDPFPDPALLDPEMNDKSRILHGEVEGMIQRAYDQGFSPALRDQLKNLVHSFKGIFFIGLSGGPPAKLKPLEIELAPDAKPIKVKLRKYSQEQKCFLSNFVSELMEKGMLYPNPTAAWAAAPLLVPKPGPAKFRFTVDLRPVNKYTLKHQYPMPNIEFELHRLTKATCFATFDLSHGYWQLPLHPDSQALQSFITPDGVYSPTRVLHGTTNAVAHLQSSLASVFSEELKKSVLAWLDDILGFAVSDAALLIVLENFFSMCASYNLKLHPGKCELYSDVVRWCGRLISKEGIKFDPRNMDGLLNMEPPNHGGDLQQFLCALQWVKTCIPQFNALIEPLHLFMENVYEVAGKRTKRAVSRVRLTTLAWGDAELTCFEKCKSALANQINLHHRDASKRLCVYTDSSDHVWSGIVTQVPFGDLALAHAEQRHEPLAFISGRFSDREYRWSILEKEAYAILATMDRMHWVLATPCGFDLFTDHNNLIFIFDPLSIMPDLSQSSLKKVLRWAVRMSIYNYTCVHISGEENVWADLLGRWSAPKTIRRLISIPALPSSSSAEFIWPTRDEIATVQKEHRSSMPDNLEEEDGLFMFPSKSIWIPDESDDLQLRICIIGHTGPAGHRGVETTTSAIKEVFQWSTLRQDVQAFCKSCIHCVSTLGGRRVPRPYGPAVHGSKPNDLLQFDYLEIAPSKTGSKYLLLLRDDFSSYSWLVPFASANANNTADALIEWSTTFTAPVMLMSDCGTHFKNATVRKLARGLKTPHHFTLPYSPWSNGAVERLGREVLRMFRSIMSELELPVNEWTDIVPVVQSALNNAPSPQRGGLCPITIFTGLEPSPPVSTFKRSATDTIISVDEAVNERLQNMSTVQDLLSELHPIVANTLEKNRQRARTAASKGTLPNFVEGDYVLVAREEFSKGEKIALRWRGPRRIVAAKSDFIFQVEDLRNGSTEDIHIARLKFYSDDSLDATAIMPHVTASETGMPVARLMGIQESPDGPVVHVRWKGLPDSEDTYEPILKVYEDVPVMLLNLLKRKSISKSLVTSAKSVLGL